MADKKEETVEETQADEVVAEKTEAVEETVEAAQEEEPKEKTESKSTEEAKEEKPGDEGTETLRKRRAEKVGIVYSDKMDKTVTVRVDRMVKHQLYQKYMKKRKKFMAHDELGSTVGDRVRIVETRPLSARKRWRVVEIIQKAQK